MIVQRLSLLFIILVTLAPTYQNNVENFVQTPLGLLEGSRGNSRLGKQFFSFRGIPYAQPPVGDLRFKAPVPIEKWNGTYKATSDGPVCPQPYFGLDLQPQSEDCLYLNVYTHEINETARRPVVIWMHSSAYVVLTGQSAWRGPEYLMDHADIVLVTINYRLGALGFLSTGDEVAPGNYGSKDQVQAIRWVKENIHSFGGNSDDITLGGYSAGASSVILHMISPMSQGLFKKAIVMSGGALAGWRISVDPLRTAKKYGELLNCSTSSNQKLIDCLRGIKDSNAFSNVYPKLWEFGHDPLVVMSPVIEEDRNDGSKRFLIKDPAQSLLEGDFYKVPVLIGSCHDEFSYKAVDIDNNELLKEELIKNWTVIAPKIFYFEASDTKAEKVKSFYLENTNSITAGLGKLYSDGIITIPTLRAARVIAEKSPKNVFLYLFTYQGQYSHIKQLKGVFHQDDLIYLFYISKLFPEFGESGNDANVTNMMTTLWTNFIRTGEPTPTLQQDLNYFNWTRFDENSPSYVDINSQLTKKEGMYFSDRLQLWDELFPLKSSSFEPPKVCLVFLFTNYVLVIFNYYFY